MKNAIVKIFAIFALAIVLVGVVSVSTSGHASAHAATAQQQTIVNADCTPFVYGRQEWWGSWVYLDHCTLTKLEGSGAIQNLAATYIATKIGGPDVGLISAFIGFYIWGLARMDNSCNNHGVIIELPRLGSPFAVRPC